MEAIMFSKNTRKYKKVEKITHGRPAPKYNHYWHSSFISFWSFSFIFPPYKFPLPQKYDCWLLSSHFFLRISDSVCFLTLKNGTYQIFKVTKPKCYVGNLF